MQRQRTKYQKKVKIWFVLFYTTGYFGKKHNAFEFNVGVLKKILCAYLVQPDVQVSLVVHSTVGIK